ncbi:cytochrome P460 family protein [Thauera mechernichensis]|nr:cytochrome P460 family protein [Thauera mechernichensis]MDG3063761.1 cytochrome P460 family protein [Thauera mechernichensis]
MMTSCARRAILSPEIGHGRSLHIHDADLASATCERETDMKILILAGCIAGCLTAPVFAAQDTSDIAVPEGYRSWFHHHSTLNMQGHEPEGNVGIQHVYANPAAVAGLKAGKFEDGATFVVDRFAYVEGLNSSISQGKLKVVAVMIKDAAKYPGTGGWGFQAFKGGDPNVKAVKDGGTACFSCHIPYQDNDFVITRNAD